MSLTITNEETCRLAEELADMTGASPSVAIDKALRLAVEREQNIKRQVDKVMAIVREATTNLQDGPGSQDIDSFLYDEWGLPR